MMWKSWVMGFHISSKIWGSTEQVRVLSRFSASSCVIFWPEITCMKTQRVKHLLLVSVKPVFRLFNCLLCVYLVR